MIDVRPNISIIVPVYNVEKYLVRCLDSIFNQQFWGTFEVIAVEDASTDNSLQVLRSYQEKETSLKIIEHGVNKKLSIARKTGMSASTGEYIMHVDSDDWLMPNILGNLYLKCLETNADVVVFNYLRESSEGERKFVNNIKHELITTNKLDVQPFFYGAVWNKIVKRELIEKMFYGELSYKSTEDLIYCSEILIRANIILLMPKVLYVYYENTESITLTYTPSKYMENQILILSSIESLNSIYNPAAPILKNIVDYFLKWIFLSIAKMHFLYKDNDIFNEYTAILSSHLLLQNNRKKIELCLKSGFYSLWEATRRFGIRTAIWIIYIRIRKMIV